MPDKPLVIEAVAVEVGRGERTTRRTPRRRFAPRAGALAPIRTSRIYTGGAFHARAGLRSRATCGRATRSPARR